MENLIQKGMTVLFQGDSITDAGRDRENLNCLGKGYPNMTAVLYGAINPDSNVTFYNRGISGDRTVDLKNRWTEDCIALKPDILSIFIGINDTWRKYDKQVETTVEEYYENYKSLLTRVALELPQTKVVLMEPFVLPYPQDRRAWREDLDPKITVVRDLAAEFENVVRLIPLDGAINSVAALTKPQIWAGDGVHLTDQGAAFTAKLWLEHVCGMRF